MIGRALALLDGDAVVGFALCDYLTESNLLHLKYLAVDPTRRNQGSGARLLQAVAASGETIAQAASRDGCRGVLIEIEIPDSPPPDADRSLRTRRIAFYERNGALITGVPYPRPPSAPPEQPDFELMLLPGSAWTGSAFTGVLDGRDAARSGPRAHGRGLRRRSRGRLVRGIPGADRAANVGRIGNPSCGPIGIFATPTGLCYNLLAWDSQVSQRIDRQHLPDS